MKLANKVPGRNKLVEVRKKGRHKEKEERKERCAVRSAWMPEGRRNKGQENSETKGMNYKTEEWEKVRKRR